MIAAACSGTNWPDAVSFVALFLAVAVVGVALIKSDRFR